MSYELTIVVPVYNEADNLLRVERALAAYLPTAEIRTKVLFVNDGSSDNSLALIEQITARQPDFEYISLEENQGLSTVLKVGFDRTHTRWVGYIDSDLQTTPEDFNKLLKYRDEYELVTGIRADRKDSFVKNASGRIAKLIRWAFTRDGVQDTGCPLKVIRTECAKKIPMFKGLHRFLPAMILLQGARVKQVPVRHFPRMAGKGKYHLWNRLLGPLVDCFAYLWMKRRYIRYDIDQKAGGDV